MPFEAPAKRVLVVESDEIVAFIASHILSRYDFAVQTATSAAVLEKGFDGFDAVIVSDEIARQVASMLDGARTVILGRPVEGIKPFDRLRKPLEIDRLVSIVTACANRR